MRYVFTLVVALIPAIALASGNSEAAKISYLYQRSSDGLIAIYKESGDWNNPDNCQSSSRLVLAKDNSSREEHFSAILASKMSGSDFKAWLSGCVEWNGVTYPRIAGVYTY